MPLVRRVPLEAIRTIANALVGQEVASLTEFEELVFTTLSGSDFLTNVEGIIAEGSFWTDDEHIITYDAAVAVVD